MTFTNEEAADQQASITRLLIHHVHAPLVDGHYLRGILPVPPPAATVRVAVGDLATHTPQESIAYEIPLGEIDDPLTAYEVTGILRAVLSGTSAFSLSSSPSSTMGMPLIHVDPKMLQIPAPTQDDEALRILRSLAQPFTEDEPLPRLRGFIFLEENRLRLYVDSDESLDVIAVDVRPLGAVTAVVAALPSLITEQERAKVDAADPHCSAVIDLTDW
ncbi:hypothetical protein [Streptomyces buecherae]|uniref:Uncharacterized protein n=1 Tax=Streptomyces buecherae TaxID=2763006 RepID=A0A7H8NGC6_9ACTN|nr:hypothetical protein [Streptomyces buecherae]QKW53501.1 hypothetical protein HUT08_32570 [Streptomyces buecherae]